MFNTIFGLIIGFGIVWMVACFCMRMFEHGTNICDRISDRAPWNSYRDDDDYR